MTEAAIPLQEEEFYPCQRPPTISKRKKSVSRTSGSHGKRISSTSLFGSDCDNESFCSGGKRLSSSSSSIIMEFDDIMDMDDHDGKSPTSVIDIFSCPSMDVDTNTDGTCCMDGQSVSTYQQKWVQMPPTIPSLSSSSSSSSASSCIHNDDGSPSRIIPSPRTPTSCRQSGNRIRKWKSFHEDGQDWGISEECQQEIIQVLQRRLEEEQS